MFWNVVKVLLIILHAIETLDTLLEGNHVLWHTDNIVATIIVKKDSNKRKTYKYW